MKMIKQDGSQAVQFRKVLLSVSQPVLADVDRVAQVRGETRSALVRQVLRDFVRAEGLAHYETRAGRPS